MFQANQTAGVNSAGPSCSSNQSQQITTGPLVVEVHHYDDESRFGFDRVVSFDVSFWSADRFRQFWEFLHNN